MRLFVIGLTKLVEKDGGAATGVKSIRKRWNMRVFAELLSHIDQSGYFAKSAVS